MTDRRKSMPWHLRKSLLGSSSTPAKSSPLRQLSNGSGGQSKSAMSTPVRGKVDAPNGGDDLSAWIKNVRKRGRLALENDDNMEREIEEEAERSRAEKWHEDRGVEEETDVSQSFDQLGDILLKYHKNAQVELSRSTSVVSPADPVVLPPAEEPQSQPVHEENSDNSMDEELFGNPQTYEGEFSGEDEGSYESEEEPQPQAPLQDDSDDEVIVLDSDEEEEQPQSQEEDYEEQPMWNGHGNGNSNGFARKQPKGYNPELYAHTQDEEFESDDDDEGVYDEDSDEEMYEQEPEPEPVPVPSLSQPLPPPPQPQQHYPIPRQYSEQELDEQYVEEMDAFGDEEDHPEAQFASQQDHLFAMAAARAATGQNNEDIDPAMFEGQEEEDDDDDENEEEEDEGSGSGYGSHPDEAIEISDSDQEEDDGRTMGFVSAATLPREQQQQTRSLYNLDERPPELAEYQPSSYANVDDSVDLVDESFEDPEPHEAYHHTEPSDEPEKTKQEVQTEVEEQADEEEEEEVSLVGKESLSEWPGLVKPHPDLESLVKINTQSTPVINRIEEANPFDQSADKQQALKRYQSISQLAENRMSDLNVNFSFASGGAVNKAQSQPPSPQKATTQTPKLEAIPTRVFKPFLGDTTPVFERKPIAHSPVKFIGFSDQVLGKQPRHDEDEDSDYSEPESKRIKVVFGTEPDEEDKHEVVPEPELDTSVVVEESLPDANQPMVSGEIEIDPKLITTDLPMQEFMAPEVVEQPEVLVDSGIDPVFAEMEAKAADESVPVEFGDADVEEKVEQDLVNKPDSQVAINQESESEPEEFADAEMEMTMGAEAEVDQENEQELDNEPEPQVTRANQESEPESEEFADAKEDVEMELDDSKQPGGGATEVLTATEHDEHSDHEIELTVDKDFLEQVEQKQEEEQEEEQDEEQDEEETAPETPENPSTKSIKSKNPKARLLNDRLARSSTPTALRTRSHAPKAAAAPPVEKKAKSPVKNETRKPAAAEEPEPDHEPEIKQPKRKTRKAEKKKTVEKEPQQEEPQQEEERAGRRLRTRPKSPIAKRVASRTRSAKAERHDSNPEDESGREPDLADASESEPEPEPVHHQTEGEEVSPPRTLRSGKPLPDATDATTSQPSSPSKRKRETSGASKSSGAAKKKGKTRVAAASRPSSSGSSQRRSGRRKVNLNKK